MVTTLDAQPVRSATAQDLAEAHRRVFWNDVLTFSPALSLTAEQADEIVAVVDQAITDGLAAPLMF